VQEEFPAPKRRKPQCSTKETGIRYTRVESLPAQPWAELPSIEWLRCLDHTSKLNIHLEHKEDPIWYRGNILINHIDELTREMYMKLMMLIGYSIYEGKELFDTKDVPLTIYKAAEIFMTHLNKRAECIEPDRPVNWQNLRKALSELKFFSNSTIENLTTMYESYTCTLSLFMCFIKKSQKESSSM
jgi:hypothetical protein